VASHSVRTFQRREPGFERHITSPPTLAGAAVSLDAMNIYAEIGLAMKANAPGECALVPEDQSGKAQL